MSPALLRQLLSLVLLVVLLPYVVNQVRRPTRWVGRIFLQRMNQSHSHLTDWGLARVQVQAGFHILDVGCGGGRTIQKLAALASAGRVDGIDYSIGSVEMSRELNAQLIQESRVGVQEASVSKLPFGDATFDLVTAVETHYYWPDLAADAREILRVLKPGGVFVTIAEAYKGRYGFFYQLAMLPLRAKLMTADEHRAWLASAGFREVRVHEERARGWICVTGRRG